MTRMMKVLQMHAHYQPKSQLPQLVRILFLRILTMTEQLPTTRQVSLPSSVLPGGWYLVNMDYIDTKVQFFGIKDWIPKK